MAVSTFPNTHPSQNYYLLQGRNDLPEIVQCIWWSPYKAYFDIGEQGGHFVFHNAPLLFRLSLSPGSLAGQYVW
jgi:hypothetical protein